LVVIRICIRIHGFLSLYFCRCFACM